MPADKRPLLLRLDEATVLNVDNRTRENLCAEAATVIRRLIDTTERLAEKAREISDPQAGLPVPVATEGTWNHLYWLAVAAQLSITEAKGEKE